MLFSSFPVRFNRKYSVTGSHKVDRCETLDKVIRGGLSQSDVPFGGCTCSYEKRVFFVTKFQRAWKMRGNEYVKTINLTEETKSRGGREGEDLCNQ